MGVSTGYVSHLDRVKPRFWAVCFLLLRCCIARPQAPSALPRNGVLPTFLYGCLLRQYSSLAVYARVVKMYFYTGVMLMRLSSSLSFVYLDEADWVGFPNIVDAAKANLNFCPDNLLQVALEAGDVGTCLSKTVQLCASYLIRSVIHLLVNPDPWNI